MADKPHAPQTLDGAWREFHAAQADVRAAVEATPRFRNDAGHRSQAGHMLAEAQAMAYGFAIAPRLDPPQVYTRTWYSHVYTLGGTSPDFYYGALFLDGKCSYRVSGRFGDFKIILMQVYSHLLGHPQSKMLTNVDFATFERGPDGSFEAIVSANPQPGNWVPLDPHSDYNFIFLRRMTDDWYGDRGALDIVPLNAPAPHRDLEEAAMAQRIDTAAHFLRFVTQQWGVGIYDLYLAKNGGRKNVTTVVPGESIAADYIGSPSTNYVFGVYDIAADEALIIDSEVPQAGYWSLQVMDVWCRSFDFIHRQTDVNMARAVVDRDGRYRGVIALSDPGVANWLDPMGRHEGTICGRSYQSRALLAAPVTKLVKLADLRQHLPADTTFVTPEQRRAALEYRRRGYMKMYGE
jgi:hypothetical protein